MAFKYILMLFTLLIFRPDFCFGQKRGYLIGVDKLLIDARDIPFKDVKGGDTLYFAAGNRKYLNIRNFKGSPGKPIILINLGGEVIIDTDHYFGISIQNCRYIRLTGTGSPDKIYGFKITRVANGAGLGVGYLSSDFEIDHLSIENTLIGGIYAKTDPECSTPSTRGIFTQYNTVIHDNYIANTGNEGMYIGSTKYDGQVDKCHDKDTLLLPSLLEGVKIYHNIVKYSGWDGIQVSSASRNCQIYDNTVLYDSQKQEDGQMSGILLGGGTKCDCYNNYIAHGLGDGIECHGLGGTRIFNNIVTDAGHDFTPSDKTKMKHGIYVTDVSVQKDSSFFILHNNIIHPKSDGIRFSSVRSKGNLISGNVIIGPGNFDYYEKRKGRSAGKDSYIMLQNPGINTTLTNNYLAKEGNDAGFVSSTMESPGDFALKADSPLIDAVEVISPPKITFDFLHHPRPSGPKPDIGAFEFEKIALPVTVKSAATSDPAKVQMKPGKTLPKTKKVNAK
jgi:hypothetical protein